MLTPDRVLNPPKATDRADVTGPARRLEPLAVLPARRTRFGRRPPSAVRPEPGYPPPQPAWPPLSSAANVPGDDISFTGRPPGGRRMGPTRVLALTAAVAAVSVLAVVVTWRAPRVGSGNRGPGQSGAAPAALSRGAATRSQAASWVAQQVSNTNAVACDRVMCTALAAHGFPAASLRPMGPDSPYPLTSVVVVETPAVHAQFGSSLDTNVAPAVLARFGAGAGTIEVRVIAPHGAASYWQALRADQAARKAAGSTLLQTSQITVSATARRQLAAGQVDSRLVVLLADLASAHPLTIVQFGDPGPGAGPEVPLRFADLAENAPSGQQPTSAYVRSMLHRLGPQSPQYRPTEIEALTLPTGKPVVRITYQAPTPLNLIGPAAGG